MKAELWDLRNRQQLENDLLVSEVVCPVIQFPQEAASKESGMGVVMSWL